MSLLGGRLFNVDIGGAAGAEAVLATSSTRIHGHKPFDGLHPPKIHARLCRDVSLLTQMGVYASSGFSLGWAGAVLVARDRVLIRPARAQWCCLFGANA